MRVEIPSTGVEDQTSDEWNADAACAAAFPPGHQMVSIKTSSNGVPYVERCNRCGWIDPVALEFHVTNAIKINATARAQRIAIAAEGQPFRFVQSSGQEDLDLEEILLQALAAAHLYGVEQSANASDGQRLTQIFKATMLELRRLIAKAKEEVAR